MKENLQELLKKFSSEVGDTLIATGIVNIDGGLEGYAANEVRGKTYNIQRSATIFAMIVNILNNTLNEIYEGKDEVDEVLVTSKKSYFLVRMIEAEKYFQGVTFTIDGDLNHVRQIMQNYKSLIAEQLNK
jgi:hypothetical protein